jgi:very-short-patch-repair endonuclease
MPRPRYRPKTPGSRLEERFLILWQAADSPQLEREYRFHDQRRWRADFAHIDSRTPIEIEGGIWVNGRHNRAAGFNADLEKYLEASLGSWRVFRLSASQITLPIVGRLVAIVRHGSPQDS